MKRLILLPTFNEISNLPSLIPALNEIVRRLEIEILFIDDNSPDGTGAYIEEQQKCFSWIHVIHNAQKAGLGKAYLQGMKWALDQGHEAVLQMDSDFSHPMDRISEMFSNLENFDVVVGSRYVSGGKTENWPLYRRLLSLGGSLYARVILGLKIRDLTAGFNCWHSNVLRKILVNPPTSEGYSFQIEMKLRAVRAGFKVLEIPITFKERKGGHSKMNRQVIIEALFKVWKWRFNEFRGR